ncbi:MAG TPA: hypothetical protein VJI32_02070 [Candidatus Nanoarchaeia archaeon]|nr:hypothetical protein [Candidatus Nanoarchaeia archaeon]
MSFFNATQLLGIAAREYQQRKETFSTAEITARINEIKYLSGQKKVPKLSLRKEIVHLEQKLSTVMDVEQRMLAQKKQESMKEKNLKKQVADLKHRLASAHNKDVQKKLDRITGLLGDYVAKKRTEEEVKAAIAQLKGDKGIIKSPKLKLVVNAEQKESLILPPIKDEQPRIEMLQQRVAMLKGEWELLKILKKDMLAKGVEEKITLLEEKLNKYGKLVSIVEAPSIPVTLPVVEKKERAAPVMQEGKLSLPVPEIKHTLLFTSPPQKDVKDIFDEDLEMEKELPLPPPPKMRKRI